MLNSRPDLMQKKNFIASPDKILDNIYFDELCGASMKRIIEILSSNPDLPEAGLHDRPKVKDNEPYGEIYDARRVKYFTKHPEEITPIDISVWDIENIGLVHMIDDGWHRTHAAVLLGINIMCGDFLGTKEVYEKIKV